MPTGTNYLIQSYQAAVDRDIAEARTSSTAARMVGAFHEWGYGEKFGEGACNPPELRIRLHNEENNEVVTALHEGSRSYADYLTAVAKELADVLYVAYGTAHSLGIPLDDVFRVVHISNLTKRDAAGNPLKRADGKILKGLNYVPPEPTIRNIIVEELRGRAVTPS